MALVKSLEDIETAVRQELSDTQFASLSLTPLSGGNANFIYRAKLERPLSNGVSEVLVKHGEGYVALNPAFALTKLRCEIEAESLKLLSNLPHTTSPAYDACTPHIFHFNANTSTQIQEYLPAAISLKNYALEHYQSPTPEDANPQCAQLGESLGRWLRTFHDWSDGPGRQTVRPLFARNSDMQAIKKTMNYDQLLVMGDEFPGLFLPDDQGVLQQIVDMATAELRHESRLEVIHGDFWTGNILLPDVPIKQGTQTPVRIVDWEMAQVGVRAEDLGQLIAELWQLKLYKDIDAGLWIINGFVDGYGGMGRDFAFRALLHVGAHLICFGSRTPNWGTREQNEGVARVGREVLLGAWRRDVRAFEDHDLGCVLG